MKLIIGITGSVATIKLDALIREFRLKKKDIDIRLVYTANSVHFMKNLDQEVMKTCPKYTDEDEWNTWNQAGDPVLHIELRNWADLILIAPLDANTMAKISNGLCDNLLTCILRAWNMKEKGKSVFLSPAMNTEMWNHLITAEHLDKLKGFGYNIIMPIEKKLACGDTGMGAMAHVENIVEFVISSFIKNFPRGHPNQGHPPRRTLRRWASIRIV